MPVMHQELCRCIFSRMAGCNKTQWKGLSLFLSIVKMTLSFIVEKSVNGKKNPIGTKSVTGDR